MFSYTTGWTVVRLAATGRLEAPDNPLFEDVAAWRPWQLAYTNSRKSVTAAFTTQIEIDGEGVAWIGGTRVKVIEVVLDKIAYGWSPEEIHFQHPPLTLAQIHGALTFYYENQQTLDAEIRRRLTEAVELSAQASDPDFRRKLIDLKSTL